MNLQVHWCGASTAVLLGALALAGCGNADGSSPEPVTAKQEGVINGKLLHQVTYSAVHTLEFWELADGQYAARESIPADSVERPVLNGLPQRQLSLSEIYRLAEPTSQRVPVAIQEADLHADEYARGHVVPPSTWAQRSVHPQVSGSELDPKQPLMAGGATGCSPDYYNDGYGGQWFLNRECNEGQFRWCLQNRTSGAIEEQSTWFKWTVMAPDFVLAVNMHGGHWYCDQSIPLIGACGWQYREDYNFPVQPRQIQGWVYSGSGDRDAYAQPPSACPRVHYVAEWNQ